MTVEVRHIMQIDEAVAEAFARLIPQLSSQLSSQLRVPDAGWLRAVAASSTSALFAAFAGERVVGVLALAWYDVPSGRKAWIEDVVVDAAARGLGAGEALVHAALDHAAQVGAGKVLLTSSAVRQAAHALYRKVGFKEAETTVFVFKIEK